MTAAPRKFAFLVDLNNDGKAEELLPEFDRPNVPAAWFEHKNGGWIRHVIAPQSYGHGIGVGDMNGDGRNDVLTPKGGLRLRTMFTQRATGSFIRWTGDGNTFLRPAHLRMR